jgi:hypothetical protein
VTPKAAQMNKNLANHSGAPIRLQSLRAPKTIPNAKVSARMPPMKSLDF